MNREIELQVFYEMFRIRRIAEAIRFRYKQQKMRCPVHLSIGQEAVAVGVCSHLKKEDAFFGNQYSHACYLAKGGNFHQMIAELYGKKTGCSSGRGGSMHLIDLNAGFQGSSPISAGNIPIATGWAFAAKMKKEPFICCTFFGEAATEEGVFVESLNFAALKKLPILFICENNLYAPHFSIEERQSGSDRRVEIAKAHGVYAHLEKESQIEKIYDASKEAIDYIRSGSGPAFIEFETYRLSDHISSRKSDLKDPSNRDTINEKGSSFIEQFRDKLMQKQLLTINALEEMEAKVAKEIQDAFAFAEESPFPIFDLDDENAYAR